MNVHRKKVLFLIVISISFWAVLRGQNPQYSDNQILKVAVYDSPPFGYQNPNGTIDGLMVEIWEEIAAVQNYQYEYIMTDMDGLLSGIHERIYDVGIGAISITPNREQMVDFTQPVNPSGTGIAVASQSLRSSISTYYKPIVLSLMRLIVLLVIILLISGTLVWSVERKNNPQHFPKGITGLLEGLWWSAVTMATVGYGDKVPITPMGRIIAMFWMFIGIILLSIFTANTTAIFTTTKQESHIQTASDLRNVRVGAVSRSSGEEYLLREKISYQAYETIESAAEALISNELDALVSNVPVLKYLNHKGPYRKKLTIASHYLLKNNMGIAVQENSPLLETIDQTLLQVITEPKWQESVYNYFGDSE